MINAKDLYLTYDNNKYIIKRGNFLVDPSFIRDDNGFTSKNPEVVPVTTVYDHTNDPIVRHMNNLELLEQCQYNFDYLQTYCKNQLFLQMLLY